MSPSADIISTLPDILLHHILSFIPAKEAAATIILSKRWKPLWFSQRILNLDDIPNFVNTAVQWNVQYLSIDLSNSLFPTFVLLTTKFLSVLKLMRLLLDDFPSVDLPSLKFLHLESVTFTHYEYMIKILSSCPVLEELETKDLTVKEIYRVHPECPDTYVTVLSKLSRANISGDHILYDCLHSANHLQLHVVRATMLIYSNNIGLISFYPAKYASLRYPCNFFC
jgi:hypothetical protein